GPVGLADADAVPAIHHRQPQPRRLLADRHHHRRPLPTAELVDLLVGEEDGRSRAERFQGCRELHRCHDHQAVTIRHTAHPNSTAHRCPDRRRRRGCSRPRTPAYGWVMTAETTLHDFTATTLTGGDQPLDAYAGQVVLVVNTASQCGLTPQYAGLEELWQTYRDRGFVVLGFPCNQFGGQEPGTEEQIATFCETSYGVTFPMFAKVDVNGRDAHPLFAWLRQEKGG